MTLSLFTFINKYKHTHSTKEEKNHVETKKQKKKKSCRNKKLTKIQCYHLGGVDGDCLLQSGIVLRKKKRILLYMCTSHA